ncbi:hypothetical protein CS0771_23000 [Catellatospora sp. IY07-71]|uniref:hypothetical protein n=1 Tax=Catellatospora sp. IY07-71 TaxID=2728827 RepID=UPI001BB34718|nr:hypothetical protein [Catellatospora sp. IY07-71]BCJ72756.1 hypothetical protein CS0771_23000 [Catellatospora sp. IY07-71]
MELLVGVLVVTAVLVAVMVFIVARRSRSRLDPSQDAYQGFPDHKTPGPFGQHHSDSSSHPGAGSGSGGSF